MPEGSKSVAGGEPVGTTTGEGEESIEGEEEGFMGCLRMGGCVDSWRVQEMRVQETETETKEGERYSVRGLLNKRTAKLLSRLGRTRY